MPRKRECLSAIGVVEVSYVDYVTGTSRGKPSAAELAAMADRVVTSAAREVLGCDVQVLRRPVREGRA